jgi:nucleotide-binding universal stress UspA family protein
MTMPAFNKILCPTDFSEASYEGLDKAVQLASDAATEICLVHVEPQAHSITPYAGHAPEAHQEALRRAETVKNLCDVLEQRVPKNVRTRPLLKQGDTATEIIRAAREEGADLIVLTTHGAGGLAPGELGRVAATIVQTAPCAVLTVNRSSKVEASATESETTESHTFKLRPAYETNHALPNAMFLDGD